MKPSYLVFAVATLVFLIGSSVDAAQIGLWHMEDCGGATLTDSSGQGNHGVNSATTSVTGVLGNGCGYFTNAANNSRTNITTNALLKNATAAVTINMWVKRSSQGVAVPLILNYASSTASRGLYFYLQGLQPGIQITNATGASVGCPLLGPNTIPIDSWTMVTGVYNKPNLTIYVNGQVAASRGCSINDIVYANTPIIFADYDPPNTNKFNGSLDEVAIWNSSLSAAEIFAQYQYGTASHQNCQTYWEYCQNFTITEIKHPTSTSLTALDFSDIINSTNANGENLINSSLQNIYIQLYNNSYGWTVKAFNLTTQNGLGTVLLFDSNITPTGTATGIAQICLNASAPHNKITYTTDITMADTIPLKTKISLNSFTPYYYRNFTFLEQSTGLLYDFTNKDTQLTATCQDYSTITVNLSATTNSNLVIQTLQRPRFSVITNGQPARIRDDVPYQLRDNYILTDSAGAQQFYFRLNDYTGGQFYQSTIAFKTPIPGYGPQNIHVEQFSDDNIVYPLLVNQTSYDIVLSTETKTRDLGGVFLRGDETVKEVIVTRPDFTMTKSTWENNNLTIIWNYAANQITCAWDLNIAPTLVNYTVYNVSGTTKTQTYTGTATTASGTLAYTVQNNNGTYFVRCETTDPTYGSRYITDTINFRNTTAILGGFDMNLPATVAGLGRSTLYKLLAVVVICLFAGMFGMRDIGLGGIVTSALMVLFNWVGWLSIPWWMVAFLFTIAVFFKLMEGRTGVVN